MTLQPQSFIYTGGREEGFRVGFINYARFPKEPGDIVARATDLARNLIVGLGQHSYSIVTPIETTWRSRREETPSPSDRSAPSIDPLHGSVGLPLEQGNEQ